MSEQNERDEPNVQSNYCAYITTIKEIRKHNNADRLQCAVVFGNNTIVDLSYKIGQRVIYFPVDGQLSEEYANSVEGLVKRYVPTTELSEEELIGKQIINRHGVDVVNVGGYLDPKKRKVRALKLRGEISDGMILPIETLSPFTDISKLHDGDEITVLNGHEICRKYIPKTSKVKHHYGNNHVSNKKEEKFQVSYPYFMQHSDTKQLVYYENAFRPGDTCYITLKMHGTSGRTANALEVTKEKRNLFLRKVLKLGDKEHKEFKCVSGTRRTTLRNYDGGFYGSNNFRKKYHDLFKDKLPKGFEVFYEIVGFTEGDTPIMGRCANSLITDKAFRRQYGEETVFSYGCNTGENDCYVYRMTATNDDGYVVEIPWEQVVAECAKIGVKTVPTFEKFIYTTWDDLMRRVEKYYDGPDPIGKTHIREGVVVRIDNREKFTAFKHKNFNFKLLSGIIVDALTDEEISGMSDEILSEL